MEIGFVSLVVICFVIVRTTDAQNLESPCPRLFVYESPGTEPNIWYGIVNLLSDVDLKGIWLRLMFDRPSIQLGNWFGEVHTDDHVEYLIKNKNHNLPANIPYSVRFYVKYDPEKPAPRLVGFRLNAKAVCPEGQTVPSTADPKPFTNEITQATTPTTRQTTITTARAPSPEVQHPIRGTYKCGRPSVVRASPLILHGQNSTDGEWPWHVALYKNTIGTSKYTCGGTLISNDFIVTAAHCVTDSYTGERLSSNSFLVYIGKSKIKNFLDNKQGTASLKNFSPGLQIAKISRIRVHPDYNRQNFHDDIAMLKTDRPIEYTDYVKPICLWNTDAEIKHVVGSLGTVAGWGLDESNTLSEILKSTKMPIVEPLECIYSKPEFYGKYTSLTSYCAGFRNGSGACNGDSGSGMVLPRRDADGEISWYLRGLVSVSVPLKESNICDPSHYIVFTDVAKYLPWIQRTIKEAY